MVFLTKGFKSYCLTEVWREPKKNSQDGRRMTRDEILTLYTLTPVYNFSVLFSIHFPGYLEGEFV